MRILLALGDSPWPARSGGDLRNAALHRALGALGTVGTVIFPSRPVDRTVLPANAIVHPLAVAIGPSRVIARLRALVARRHHFVEQAVEAGAVQVLIDDVQRLAPDVVVLTFPLFGPFPAAVRPLASILIVDLSELRAPLARRRLKTAGSWKGRLQAAVDLLTASPGEASAIRIADAVWVSSAAEARALVRRRPRRVDVIGNSIDPDAYRRYRGVTPAPVSVAFVGAFDYEPNETAAIWLIDRVLPKLRRRHPDARLVLIGRSPTSRLRRRSREAGVELRANVPDAIAELAAVGLLAVGLQSGGGTRLKILEAWAAGVPVISTAIGIEGLEHEDGRDVLVADTADAMAMAIARTWDAPDLRAALVRGGLERVRERYGIARLAADVRAAVEALGR